MAVTPDLQKTLDDIRREVIESRNLTIKNDNALKVMHGDVRTLAARQDASRTSSFFSTIAAYVIFTALCVAGAFGIIRARESSSSAARVALEAQVRDFQASVRQRADEDAERGRADQSALDAIKRLSSGNLDERTASVEQARKVDGTNLSLVAKAMLTDRLAMVEAEVRSVNLERARLATLRHAWSEVGAAAARVLAASPPELESKEASYYQGLAYFQTGKFEESIPPLKIAIDPNPPFKFRDYAMWLLIQAYDSSGKGSLARQVARDALNSAPNSELRPQFYNRSTRENTVRRVPDAKPQAAPAPAL